MVRRLVFILALPVVTSLTSCCGQVPQLPMVPQESTYLMQVVADIGKGSIDQAIADCDKAIQLKLDYAHATTTGARC